MSVQCPSCKCNFDPEKCEKKPSSKQLINVDYTVQCPHCGDLLAVNNSSEITAFVVTKQ